MIKNLKIIIIFTVCAVNCTSYKEIVSSNKINSPVSGSNAYQMIDPAIDDSDKPWSYSPKPTLVIGVPFSPTPVQVTYDGAIYTGQAELVFFYGKTLKPIIARQRTFFKGWIPIVQNEWEYEGIEYETEMFGATVVELGESNSLQFAKITVKNSSKKSMIASIASASRTSGLDHRYRGVVPCPPETKYQMNKNSFLRNDHLIYSFETGGIPYAVPEELYKEPFTAADYFITQRAEVGLSLYNVTLAPGEKKEWVFKMPMTPISAQEKNKIVAVQQADYQQYRDQTVQFWEELVENKVSFYFPENRVNEAYRAALVHLMLATREEDGRKRQGSGLPYDGLFLNDYVDMRLAYDFMRLPEYIDVNTPWLIEQQTEEGMFIDKSLSHGKEILASHGQALYSLAHHYALTRDSLYAKNVYASVKKGVEWIGEEHKKHKNGLLRTSTPYDNEMIKGHYTSHNLWAVLGVRSAIGLAKSLNKNEDVIRWTVLHDSYLASVKKAIKASVREGNYLPPGLYDYITGEEARAGFKEFRTSQDWENMLLLYPTELLDTKDPIVLGTIETIRKNKYREGVMTYRNGMHLHQYITYNQAQQYMASGHYKQALTDFYHIMLHNGSVHEGFENLVEPWEDRDPDPSPSPHGWAAAKTVVFARSMLVREYGGQAGLNPEERDLYLFSLLSPAWVKKDEHVEIKNAITEMGDISAQITFNEQGADVEIQSKFHQSPRYIVIPTPYFKNFDTFKSDAKKSFERNGLMYFSPDVTKISIKWDDKGLANEKNYQDILMAYRSEPGVKWKGYDAMGNPKPVMQLMDDEAGELIAIDGVEGFLMKGEENYPAEHLSFDLIQKVFEKEYQRRFNEYLKDGKKPIDSKPLPILNAKQREQLYNESNLVLKINTN